MDQEVLRKEVAKIKWWHTLDLGHGIVTPGMANNLKTLKRLGLPEDLSGKTVLDIGAWDGFYSFEAKRHGAARVLATDSFCWSGQGWGTKAGFELARKALGSKVEDMDIDVLELSPEKVGVFDLVLFLGVLYHMRHPLLALERVASVAGDHLILETHVDMLSTRLPAARFYPGTEVSDDPTNWWGPNPAAVEGMLKTVGFRRVKLFSRYHPFPYNLAAAAYFRIKRREPFFRKLQQDRMVFHAWK